MRFKPGLFLLATIFLVGLLAAPLYAQQRDSTAVADSLLILELKREMGAPPEDTPPPPSGSTTRGITSTNPNISVIGDFRAWAQSEGDRNVDFALHEAEFAFKSVVDPYVRADVYLALGEADGEYEFELEEAYLTTLSLPHQLQLRAGKFRSNIGKLNPLHPHSLPFIDTPLVYENFLGDEGLNDNGVEVSWLLPVQSFYQELTFEVLRGPAESESFAFSGTNRMLYTAHLKNFWDLSDDATLELGLSGLSGANAVDGTTNMAGVDLTYKWKPVRFNTYRSFTWQSEAFLSSRKNGAGDSVTSNGLYSLMTWQLARRWFITGRYDHADLPDDADWNEQAVSATLGWYLTEFQKIELGSRTVWSDSIDRYYEGLLRVVFVIGTHGAHAY